MIHVNHSKMLHQIEKTLLESPTRKGDFEALEKYLKIFSVMLGTHLENIAAFGDRRHVWLQFLKEARTQGVLAELKQSPAYSQLSFEILKAPPLSNPPFTNGNA
jgi:hypothetical protein